MNSSENAMQKILAAVFSVHVQKMENAKAGLMWAPVVVLAGIPIWFFIKSSERYSFLCWEIFFIGCWAWAWYTCSQHRALARSIYWALKDCGYAVRRGGLFGPNFSIQMLDASDDDADDDVLALLK